MRLLKKCYTESITLIRKAIKYQKHNTEQTYFKLSRTETFAIFAFFREVYAKESKWKIRESYFRENENFDKSHKSFFSILKAEKPKIKKGLW